MKTLHEMKPLLCIEVLNGIPLASTTYEVQRAAGFELRLCICPYCIVMSCPSFS
jgi:hypothetical protein